MTAISSVDDKGGGRNKDRETEFFLTDNFLFYNVYPKLNFKRFKSTTENIDKGLSTSRMRVLV